MLLAAKYAFWLICCFCDFFIGNKLDWIGYSRIELWMLVSDQEYLCYFLLDCKNSGRIGSASLGRNLIFRLNIFGDVCLFISAVRGSGNQNCHSSPELGSHY
jgi:hypothetical protein